MSARRRRTAATAAAAALVAALAAALVVDLVGGGDRPADLPQEGCLACHEAVAVSPSHPEEFGCSSCHLGDPRWLDEGRAHRGMVARPSELAVASRTCGQPGCHPDQVDRVSDGLMATNLGVATVLAYQFGEAADPEGSGHEALSGGVDGMLDRDAGRHRAPSPGGSLAEDHFRKFCATCHLHKSLGDMPGEIGTRGGGCADCHLARPPTPEAAALPPRGQPGWAGDGGPEVHPVLTTAVDTEECAKCHNRSARIALSYRGRFEDEGYATPYDGGGPTRRELSGGRSWSPLLPDVHHDAGMACIDCHLSPGVMGDGERYAHMEDQVAIACEDCHRPRWSGPLPPEGEVGEGTVAADAWLSARVSDRVDLAPGTEVALGRRGAPIPHLQRGPGDAGAGDGRAPGSPGAPVLVGRVDGVEHPVPAMEDAPHHALEGHERLSCQACHSAWTPQCYGCHEVYRRGERQLDKIARRETAGRWEERRSYLRFERPTLGIGPDGTVRPFAPGCQVFLTQIGDDGEPVCGDDPEAGWECGEPDGAAAADPRRFPALAMATFDPHTTRTAVPGCAACHLDPKVLGLGDGTLRVGPGGALRVDPSWDPRRSGLEVSAPLDAFVSGDGVPLQTTSRAGARPFDAAELRSIVAVGACLPCHDTYEDPVWADWSGSLARWREDASLPCRDGGGRAR